MNSVRAVMAIGFHSWHKWWSEYRIWIVCITVGLLLHDYASGIYLAAARLGYAVTPWLFPFLDYQDGYRILIYTGLILLFSDAPFIRENQSCLIIRSGRKRFLGGQMAAMLLVTMTYFLILMIAPILPHLNATAFSLRWGDVLFTAANTSMMGELSLETGHLFIISPVILASLTPVQAMLISYSLHVLTGFLLGCLICCGNIWTNGQRSIGVLPAILLIVLDLVFQKYGTKLYRFSPMSWGRLEHLNYSGLRGDTYRPAESAALLAGLSAVLIVLSMIGIRRQEIHGKKE